MDNQIFIFSQLNELVALGLAMVILSMQCFYMGLCYSLADLVSKVLKK